MKAASRVIAVGAILAALAVSQRAWLPAIAQTLTAAQTTVAKAPPAGDPFLWLEDKDGARSMAWVKEQNARTLPVIQGDSHYQAFYADALAIAQSKDRIPYPTSLGGAIYNFWQDDQHVRGVWRRTTPASYASSSPEWTTVLDLDAVSAAEHANWVWHGATCDWPEETRCLLDLSNGGEDAVTVREFDLRSGSFVKDGFTLPRGKQDVAWENRDTLLVSREWNPGELTTSGYPYIIKRLTRGEKPADATEIFRGTKSDVWAQPFVLNDGTGHQIVLITRGTSFFTALYYVVTQSGVKQLAVPEKVSFDDMLDGEMILELKQDWNVNGKVFPQGSLVAVDAAAAQADPAHLTPTLIYTPGPRESIDGVAATHSHLLVAVYQNVRGRIFDFTPNAGGTWNSKQLDLPDNASVAITDTDTHTDHAYVAVTGFLDPTTLWSVDAADDSVAVAKSLPTMFDASNDIVEQHEATSKDGTKIPYFIVHPKNMKLDGANPTLLYAYGGFQISETPVYSGVIGKLWLEHGGVYVLANIRGGGEFGPAWHDAALTIHRQRAYDDFYAVAQDLVARNITSPRHLGIMGGSNGGLLMGVEFTEHPEEWNAVVIQVPLLDMIRIGKIEAGASWAGEYGNLSDPKVLAFWEKVSPYQNLKGGVAYPEPFIWTTTKDDRVGPQHARKFAAKLAAMDVPYLFYEVTEGGHGAGANLKEAAETQALQWTYLTMKLME
ncbi:MAG TPA: prolyl oligopeptidase family serine peptidase [Candidatus Acidoferrales bacterium]|nr:prolyl oligopeptidase family serine peptidase [Candidatus Acidoferrales bacterium]